MPRLALPAAALGRGLRYSRLGQSKHQTFVQGRHELVVRRIGAGEPLHRRQIRSGVGKWAGVPFPYGYGFKAFGTGDSLSPGLEGLHGGIQVRLNVKAEAPSKGAREMWLCSSA